MPGYLWLALAGSALHGFSFAWSRQLVGYASNRLKIAFYTLLSCTVLAAAAAPFVGFGGLMKAPQYIAGMTVSIIISQALLMEALRRADASFVVPMLGIKIFVVAVMTAWLFGEIYGPLVYLAAAGAFGSLFLLNDARLRTSAGGLLCVIGASAAFACNDIFLMLQLRAGYTPGEVFIYSFLGPALVLVPLSVWLLRGEWGVSPPLLRGLAIYALVHIAGVVLLMLAFDIGRRATMINIVQNARGLFSIAVVYALARFGLSGFERLSRRQLRLRVSGALLMSGSLALAVLAAPH